MTTTTPAFYAYAVREREGKKPVWTRVGVLWPHKDREGFSLELEALPINFDGRLVLLPAKSATNGDAQEKGAA